MLPAELELTDALQDPNTFVEAGLRISAISKINHTFGSNERSHECAAEEVAYKMVEL